LRTTDFKTITRARSLPQFISGREEFFAIGHSLLDETLPLPLPVRLMGLTLSALEGDKDAEPRPDTAQLSLL
jgi:DNA polymerase-4